MCQRVLIVDDSIDMLKIIKLIAQTAGIEVCSACSGKEALFKLKTGSCRRLITDFIMPGMDGLTLARYARELSPELEVVMMTGSIMPDLHELAAMAGISRVVAKPVSSDILIELLG